VNTHRFQSRALLVVTLGLMAISGSGCWMAALELAPLGMQAASAVGNGVMNLATNSASSGKMDRAPGEDEVDYHERCDDLAQQPPAVIELRIVADGGSASQWRELRLENTAGDPSWAPAIEPGAASAWRPAENLPTMHFAPPLAPLKSGVSNYLAYAPAEPLTAAEQDQLTGLTIDFGAGVGTFDWRGRIFEYALVGKLPCFPPPAVAMR
jgi:hypothetical protein